MNKPIIFRLGEETKPVIETLDSYKNSLFSDQIEKALGFVRTKVEEGKADSPENGQKDNQREKLPFNDIYQNNIISFIGERGSGKTSCMYSVVNVLKKSQENVYHCLESIDPSFFDEHHNILELLIGRMYIQFKEKAKDSCEKRLDEHSIMDLKRLFLDTKRNLRYLEKEPVYGDDNEMEELHQLASGVDLRKSLERLFNGFLELFKKKILLITIDDIDLNVSQAYEMAEQIRKYLILPNIIILMAVKLDQLSNVIRNRMSSQYDLDIIVDEDDLDINEMAERYLVKFLPVESRIYMPQPDVMFNRPLKVYKNENLIVGIGDVKTTVTTLIFKKCRYLFYNTKGTASFVVPRNLRDLRMLVSMLVRMPEYVQKNERGEIVGYSLGNKTTFRNYFCNDWLNHLDSLSKRIAKELQREDEPTKFNKKVVQLLSRRYEKLLLPEKSPSYIMEIIDRNSVEYNVSMADAFALMDYLEKVEGSWETHYMMFFVRSLYSIRLNEYYHVMIEELKIENATENQILPFRKDDRLEEINDLLKYVGGSYFTITGDSLIPFPQAVPSDDGTRELRLIEGNELNALIRDIVARNVKWSDKKQHSAREIKDFSDDLRMAEFFMLTVSRFVFSKSGGKESKNYRQRPEVYYDRDLSNVTNMQFDVTAPFFTLLDIRRAYNRFNPDIFEIAEKWKGEKGGRESLYNSILNESQNVGKESYVLRDYNSTQKLLSQVVIRNAEVAEDLFRFLEKMRSRYRLDNRGEVGLLKQFYQNVADYWIGTYDEVPGQPNEKKSYFEIRYQPFKAFVEFLKEVDMNSFYEIYNKMLAKRVQPFDYIEKSMLRDDVWKLLISLYPSLEVPEKRKVFNSSFQKANKKYAPKAIKTKLTKLSSEWKMKLDGTSISND